MGCSPFATGVSVWVVNYVLGEGSTATVYHYCLFKVGCGVAAYVCLWSFVSYVWHLNRIALRTCRKQSTLRKHFRLNVPTSAEGQTICYWEKLFYGPVLLLLTFVRSVPFYFLAYSTNVQVRFSSVMNDLTAVIHAHVCINASSGVLWISLQVCRMCRIRRS